VKYSNYNRFKILMEFLKHSIYKAGIFFTIFPAGEYMKEFFNFKNDSDEKTDNIPVGAHVWPILPGTGD
jgi:hypothetical protein